MWRWLGLLGVWTVIAAGEPAVWATHGLVKLFPDTLPGGEPALEVDACRGDVVDAQLAVRADDQPIGRAEVEPFELRCGARRITIPPACLYAERTVLVDHPSGNADRTVHEWPEALVPRPWSRPVSVPVGRTAAWWIDLPIPSTAPAGRYVGQVPVRLDGRRRSVALVVQVHDVQLPVTRHVQANVAVYYDDLLLGYANRHWRTGQAPWRATDADFVALKEACYEALLQHRLCAYDLPVPLTSPDADKWYRDPRVHSIRLPWIDDHGSRALVDGLHRATERGGRRKLYYYAADEPSPGAYASVRQVAAEVRRLAPGVPFVATVAPVPGLFGAVDTWCPNTGNYLGLGYLDVDALAARRRVGERTWWYTCCVPLYPFPTWLVDDDAVAPRASIWQMARYGVTGFVYSMAHGWGPDPYRSVVSFNQTNGDGLLLYPGQPFGAREPFPSLRLKLLRDGLQDYELLRLLAIERDAAAGRHGARPDGQRRIAALCDGLIAAPDDVEREPAAWLAARRAALSELAAARAFDWRGTVTRGTDGVDWSGTARPGTRLTVDGLPVTVDEQGHWQVALSPTAETATASIGPRRLVVTERLQPRVLRGPTPDHWSATWTAAPLVADGRLDEPVWSTAPALALERGVTCRSVADSQALWIGIAGAKTATIVLDPGRRHRVALTFHCGDDHPAVRRTETGREELTAPWQKAGQAGTWELRLPWSALGETATRDTSWGVTVKATTADGPAIWFDHHGDLRRLPVLWF